MAFCNACGTNLEDGAKFCPKCVAAQAGATPGVASSSQPPAAPPVQSSNTLKPILIVLGVVVLVGVVAIAGLTLFGLHFARRTHVESRDGNVRVESPLGSIESTTDPSSISRDLGVDLYPNAHLVKGNAANVSVAGMHTVAAEFETDDPPEQVADFYKSKLPSANVTSSEQGRYSIVSTENKNPVTINIEAQDGKTLNHVANVSGKGVTGSSSD